MWFVIWLHIQLKYAHISRRVWQSIRDNSKKNPNHVHLMQFSDTLSPSCLRVCLSSVHCSLEHPFRHLKSCIPGVFKLFPGTQAAFESLSFVFYLRSARSFSLFCSVCLSISRVFLTCPAYERTLNSPFLHCNESFSRFPWVCVCNYCSLIAFQQCFPVFSSSPNHHTRANYNT